MHRDDTVLMYYMGDKFPVEVDFCGLVDLEQLSETKTSFICKTKLTFVKLN